MKSPIAAAVLAATLIVPGAVVASDLCVDIDGDYVVLQSYKPPKPGKCKPFKGAYSNNNAGAIDGSACTNSAGNTLRIVYTLLANSGNYSAYVNLPYPSLTGGSFTIVRAVNGNSVSTFSGSSSAVECPTKYPIP
jgi:hypothetical protein